MGHDTADRMEQLNEFERLTRMRGLLAIELAFYALEDRTAPESLKREYLEASERVQGKFQELWPATQQ